MAEILKIVLRDLLICILFIPIGLLIDHWLENQGIARADQMAVIIGVLGMVLVKELWFRNLSWWWLVVVMILGLTFSGHRRDMWLTIKHGRWWWKSMKEEKRKMRNAKPRENR